VRSVTGIDRCELYQQILIISGVDHIKGYRKITLTDGLASSRDIDVLLHAELHFSREVVLQSCFIGCNGQCHEQG
jgi:hypothetical protein